MIAIAIIAALVPAAVEVEGPASCVDPADVIVAVERAGGLDTAEHVRLKITEDGAAEEPLVLAIDIALIGVPPLQRVVPMRPIECRDVADLVEVLLKNQRRQRLVEKAAAPKGPPPTLAPTRLSFHRDPPAKAPVQDQGQRFLEEACNGPTDCAGFPALALGVGTSFPSGPRLVIDAGIPIIPSVSLLLAADGIRDKSAGASIGAAYNTHIEALRLGVRALVGVGGGRQAVAVDPKTRACVPDLAGGNSSSLGVYVAPQLGLRAALSWFYVEAGGYWSVGLDPTPGVYVTGGVTLLGR